MQPPSPSVEFAVLRARIAQSPVCRFYGFEIVSIDRGQVVLSLNHRPELGHAPGFFQATIMGAIADYAGSYAAYTLIPDDWRRLTLDYTIKFLAPAQGARLIGRGRVVTPARTLTTSAADIFVERDGAEHLVATALLTVSHTPPRSA